MSTATLIFDGDCGFCTTAAEWVSRRWPDTSPPAAKRWQLLATDAPERGLLTESDFRRAAWWIDGDRAEAGARAVARSLIAVGGRWSIVGRMLLIPPISWMARLGYLVVARYRYRLPGGTPACRVSVECSDGGI